MGRKKPIGPVAWTLELVIVILACAVIWAWLSSDRGGFERAKQAPDCGDVVTSTCVESRAGEFHARGRGFGSATGPFRVQTFEDADGDDQSFAMRLSRRDARALRGTETRGLYYDGNLVGVESASGSRHWGVAGWRGFPTRSSMLVIAGLLAAIGACVAALGVARRRG